MEQLEQTDKVIEEDKKEDEVIQNEEVQNNDELNSLKEELASVKEQLAQAIKERDEAHETFINTGTDAPKPRDYNTLKDDIV